MAVKQEVLGRGEETEYISRAQVRRIPERLSLPVPRAGVIATHSSLGHSPATNPPVIAQEAFRIENIADKLREQLQREPTLEEHAEAAGLVSASVRCQLFSSRLPRGADVTVCLFPPADHGQPPGAPPEGPRGPRRDGAAQPAPRGEHRPQVRREQRAVPGLDAGGERGPAQGAREVRPRPRVQVLHVLPLVDPPGAERPGRRAEPAVCTSRRKQQL